MELRWNVMVCALLLLAVCLSSASGGEGKPKAGKKKNLMDYSDADMEQLYKQWEDEDERDDEDNYPPRKPKPAPSFDPSKLQGAGKEGMESILQQTKKDQVLMVFVKIGSNPTKKESEDLTARWEEGLRNGGLLAQRYIISDDKAIFMLQDGSEAWRMKDFLIEQEGCVEVEIEQKKYPGKRPHRPGINKTKQRKNEL
eukprot:scpid69748/ scgid24686/ LDLR chaperone MESD; Mesoderm development candidate 2; Mesoderm development protein